MKLPVVALVGSGIMLAFPAAWADVVVQNDRMYVGHDGALHIVGEVQNNLEAPLGQVSIEATVHGADGNVLFTAEGWSLINTIMPGMKGPFDIVMYGPDTAGASGYSLAADYAIRAPKSQAIEVTSAVLERSSQRDLYITGTITNRGEITANMVSVVATIYGRDGNVATVARAHSEPDYLRASDQGAFVVSVTEKDQTSEISGYIVVAESEEYAAVPEFPLGTTLILAASAIGYAMASRHPSMVQVRGDPAAERSQA